LPRVQQLHQEARLPLFWGRHYSTSLKAEVYGPQLIWAHAERLLEASVTVFSLLASSQANHRREQDADRIKAGAATLSF
jgi:hypothetical protein